MHCSRVLFRFYDPLEWPRISLKMDGASPSFFELVHIVRVLKDNLSNLQTTLVVDDPKSALCDLRPILLYEGEICIGHDTHYLLIPLKVVHEVIDFSFHTRIMLSPHNPFVRRFLVLQAILSK